MAYTPTTWKDGDIITAEKMNKLEQGVVNEHRVAPGGTTGQMLRKASDTDYATEWANAPGVQSEAVQTIAALTQAQYDALSAKNAATLYIIKE